MTDSVKHVSSLINYTKSKHFEGGKFIFVQFLNLSILYRPADIFWLLDISITDFTMHVVCDLKGQMVEIRDLEKLSIYFIESNCLLTEIKFLDSLWNEITELDNLLAEISFL